MGGVGGHPAETTKRPSTLNFIYEHPRTAPLGSDGALVPTEMEKPPAMPGRRDSVLERATNDKWGRDRYDRCGIFSQQFNSCSIISKCADRLCLDGEEDATAHHFSSWMGGWPDYMLRWRTVDNISYKDSVLTKYSVRHMIQQALMPPCMFNWFMIRSVFAFEWTRWFDVQKEDLLESMAAEQTNVGLLSALMATIAISTVLLGDSGSGSPVADNPVYTIAWGLSTMAFICATVLSVILLLLVNELSSQDEARQFKDRMSWVATIPMFNFVVGICLGAIGVLTWFHANFGVSNLATFVVLLFILVQSTFVLPVFYGVQTLWTVGETTKIMLESKERVALSAPEIDAKLRSYVQILDKKYHRGRVSNGKNSSKFDGRAALAPPNVVLFG